MKTRAVILAGGKGSRLGVLTAKRTKPAVPFAGKYRIIDFTLSNCVNSGLFDVMLLTQYRPHSLIEHIGLGHPWDLDRSFTGGVKIYQPYQDRYQSGWYKGTADAVQQNFNFVSRGNPKPDLLLVLSGDHIYQMDYEPLITFHLEHGADMTVATMRVSREEATRFGVLATDDDYRVIEFVEKPADPPGTLISMGIYIFGRNVLEQALRVDGRRKDSAHDFGKNIIPMLVDKNMRVFAYPYSGYWVDVGTVDSYWLAHMDLLQHPPRLNLNDRSWVVHTRSEERPPVLIQKGAIVRDSLITDGSVIAAGAKVERSVLSPGVYVGPKAVVRESIILTGTYIEAGARVERAIVDKDVTIGHHARVGQISSKADALDITAVGKNAKIPTEVRIGRGCIVHADVTPDDFMRKVIGRGKEVTRREQAKSQ